MHEAVGDMKGMDTAMREEADLSCLRRGSVSLLCCSQVICLPFFFGTLLMTGRLMTPYRIVWSTPMP